jgi:hypothetical protein
MTCNLACGINLIVLKKFHWSPAATPWGTIRQFACNGHSCTNPQAESGRMAVPLAINQPLSAWRKTSFVFLKFLSWSMCSMYGREPFVPVHIAPIRLDAQINDAVEVLRSYLF